MENDYFNKRSIFTYGLPLLIIPPVLLAIIIISGDFFFLEYFHVISGSAWTGMDLVMGIFFAYIMKNVTDIERAQISRRLIPVMMFFMPAIATTTITAGIYTAMSLKINFFNYYFIAVAILALTMMVLGLLIFLPNELRIYMEMSRGGKKVDKIVKLTMFNLRISLIQLILQIVIIGFMANFAVGVY